MFLNNVNIEQRENNVETTNFLIANRLFLLMKSSGSRMFQGRTIFIQVIRRSMRTMCNEREPVITVPAIQQLVCNG